ncbi:hypothetical protein Syun_020822 [Stephania yunnanensis]|uniref:Uncharacterized protein n=1 Tax=Stephania yunnanensis TaxID=152371 RepID=A0AAP0NQD5_9MAGN
MIIIGHMVNEGTLEEGSDLWCFAYDFISDETKRKIFVNMKNDNNRKVWLDFMRRNK